MKWGNTYKYNIKGILGHVTKEGCKNYVQCQLPTSVKCVIYRTAIIKGIRFDRTKTAMIMYKAHKKYLPVNLPKKINMRLGLAYDTCQSKNIRQVFARTTQKANYISV